MERFGLFLRFQQTLAEQGVCSSNPGGACYIQEAEVSCGEEYEGEDPFGGLPAFRRKKRQADDSTINFNYKLKLNVGLGEEGCVERNCQGKYDKLIQVNSRHRNDLTHLRKSH